MFSSNRLLKAAITGNCAEGKPTLCVQFVAGIGRVDMKDKIKSASILWNAASQDFFFRIVITENDTVIIGRCIMSALLMTACVSKTGTKSSIGPDVVEKKLCCTVVPNRILHDISYFL